MSLKERCIWKQARWDRFVSRQDRSGSWGESFSSRAWSICLRWCRLTRSIWIWCPFVQSHQRMAMWIRVYPLGHFRQTQYWPIWWIQAIFRRALEKINFPFLKDKICFEQKIINLLDSIERVKYVIDKSKKISWHLSIFEFFFLPFLFSEKTFFFVLKFEQSKNWINLHN